MDEFLEEMTQLARERVGTLPEDFVITEHPHGKLRWKGTYPLGWIKSDSREEVEGWLLIAACNEPRSTHE